jgi:hypothetical protein
VFARTLPDAAYAQGQLRAIAASNLSRRPWTQAFAPGETITFLITDISGVANTIRPGLAGTLLYVTDPNQPNLAPDMRDMRVPGGPYAAPATAGMCPPGGWQQPAQQQRQAQAPYPAQAAYQTAMPWSMAYAQPGAPSPAPASPPAPYFPASIAPTGPQPPRPVLGPGYGAGAVWGR